MYSYEDYEYFGVTGTFITTIPKRENIDRNAVALVFTQILIVWNININISFAVKHIITLTLSRKDNHVSGSQMQRIIIHLTQQT